MAKIEWNRVTWYSKLASAVLFVLVFGLGLFLGAAYNEAKHFSLGSIVKNDMVAASWKWQKKLLPLAPTVVATTTPAPVTKAPKNKPIVPTVTTSTPPPAPSIPSTSPAPATPVSTGNEKRFSAYITAYTYWDNTPPGSSDISNPVIHQKAGGTGTYNDPITVAVGHDMSTGKDMLDYLAGTKFYLPYLKKYFIVEDTCGDGNRPENGPCHTGYQGNPWLDLWIDGANGSKSAANSCAEHITEIHTIIQNPDSHYAVVSGSVYNDACAEQFSDAPVIQ